MHGEGIMSHDFPCSPQGGKIAQLTPICCISKTTPGGIYILTGLNRTEKSEVRNTIQYYSILINLQGVIHSTQKS